MTRPDARTTSGQRVLALAEARGVRVAVAESLTGGLLADAFVSVPGASRVFAGGIVAYDTALKHTLVGVDADLLRLRGPVDAQVAEQMAAGVRVACARPDAPVELGIATTGVAGPDPDPQSGQPAGVVWVGLSLRDRTGAVSVRCNGDRPAIRRAAVEAALGLAAEWLAAIPSR